MTAHIESLGDQITDLYVQICQRDPAMALQVATGAFVSLLLSYMRARGFETDGEIRVDGGDERDITVHAPKHPTEQGKGGEA